MSTATRCRLSLFDISILTKLIVQNSIFGHKKDGYETVPTSTFYCFSLGPGLVTCAKKKSFWSCWDAILLHSILKYYNILYKILMLCCSVGNQARRGTRDLAERQSVETECASSFEYSKSCLFFMDKCQSVALLGQTYLKVVSDLLDVSA